jgi:hypothetical protein
MKFIEPPPVGALGSARSGDDLDGLLGTYFRAEVPHPWPELEPPVFTSVPSTRVAFWRGIKRSHLALAASVALLIGGSLLFSGKLPSIGHSIDGPPPIANHDSNDNSLHNQDPKQPKESIEVGPDGAALKLELEDRY